MAIAAIFEFPAEPVEKYRKVFDAGEVIVNHPNRDKVWFTRPGEIYDHCAALPAGIMPRPE